MKKLFCAVMCLGCVTDSFAMNSVKRFCDCIGEKVAAFIPQSRFGKAAGGVVVLVTGYSVYKLVELTERVNKLSRMLDRNLMLLNTIDRTTDQFVRPIPGYTANEDYEARIQILEKNLQDRNDTIEGLNNTVNELKQSFEELNQSIHNSAFENFSNNNDNDNDDEFAAIKDRSISFSPDSRQVSPIVSKGNILGDNSSLNLSFDLNSSLSVSSFVIPGGEEVINLKFDGFEYKGQGHKQEPQGKGEVISAASSFRMEGFFQDQQLVIDHERPVCFKISGTRFSFTLSEQCQPIVFKLNDFEQIKLVYVKNHSNYLLLLTNKANDNFIFRPAYFYKGQVNNASHLPEGNGLMVMTKDGSILRGVFKREKLIKAAEKSLSLTALEVVLGSTEEGKGQSQEESALSQEKGEVAENQQQQQAVDIFEEEEEFAENQ